MSSKSKILLFTILIFIFKYTGAFAQTHSTENSTDFLSMLFVFMLATFIGLGVITRVSRLLHTPLMSLTNAISAIAVVGSVILTGREHPTYITIMGAIALFASMTNIVSGFLITDRMLKMFKTRKSKPAPKGDIKS
jgi:NAD(P) transhydrogenase subunit alpha